MRNVTELFRQTLYERRNFKYTVKLTLTNGEEFNLTDEDFTVDGCSLFEDCGSSSFPLGGVI